MVSSNGNIPFFTQCCILKFLLFSYSLLSTNLLNVHKSILWGQWYPCFRLLVMSALGFKARVDRWLEHLLICMQGTPYIHLWCDICWPLDTQHGTKAFLSSYMYKHCWDTLLKSNDTMIILASEQPETMDVLIWNMNMSPRFLFSNCRPSFFYLKLDLLK